MWNRHSIFALLRSFSAALGGSATDLVALALDALAERLAVSRGPGDPTAA
jgi:hypothetical protein